MSINRDAARLISELFEADQRDHSNVPSVGTPEYAALRARDRERRRQAEEALAELHTNADELPVDALYQVAWLLNHGDLPAEARRAHDLARAAAARGHVEARWLAAATYDRWCMYEGRPQKYGTQFVPDGVRYRLWDLDPATTDADRAEWDVPPLAEQLQRAEDLTSTAAQPPMDDAPAWLVRALVRWRAAGT